MRALAIVKALDPIDDIQAGLGTGFVAGLIGALRLIETCIENEAASVRYTPLAYSAPRSECSSNPCGGLRCQ
jgi:hypothetical protein